jgi:hypothetical protein
MSDVDENRYPLFQIVPKRGTDYDLQIGGFDRSARVHKREIAAGIESAGPSASAEPRRPMNC